MKKHILCFIAFTLLLCLAHGENWTTLKEKYTLAEGILIAESDIGLCTLAASTNFSDGTVIFYTHAGKRDKNTLLTVYDKAEKMLSENPNENTGKFVSDYVKRLLDDGVLTKLSFETEPIDYSATRPIVRTHLYCSSWLEVYGAKSQGDVQKSYSIDDIFDVLKKSSKSQFETYLEANGFTFSRTDNGFSYYKAKAEKSVTFYGMPIETVFFRYKAGGDFQVLYVCVDESVSFATASKAKNQIIERYGFSYSTRNNTFKQGNYGFDFKDNHNAFVFSNW